MKTLSLDKAQAIVGGHHFQYSQDLQATTANPGAMLYHVDENGNHVYSFYGYYTPEQNASPGLIGPGAHYQCESQFCFSAESVVKISLLPMEEGSSFYKISVQSTNLPIHVFVN